MNTKFIHSFLEKVDYKIIFPEARKYLESFPISDECSRQIQEYEKQLETPDLDLIDIQNIYNHLPTMYDESDRVFIYTSSTPDAETIFAVHSADWFTWNKCKEIINEHSEALHKNLRTFIEEIQAGGYSTEEKIHLLDRVFSSVNYALIGMKEKKIMLYQVPIYILSILEGVAYRLIKEYKSIGVMKSLKYDVEEIKAFLMDFEHSPILGVSTDEFERIQKIQEEKEKEENFLLAPGIPSITTDTDLVMETSPEFDKTIELLTRKTQKVGDIKLNPQPKLLATVKIHDRYTKKRKDFLELLLSEGYFYDESVKDYKSDFKTLTDKEKLDNLSIAFSGKPIISQLGIPWTKLYNNGITKPLLFYCFIEYKHENNRVFDLGERNNFTEQCRVLNNIFVNHKGEQFENMSQSRKKYITLTNQMQSTKDLFDSFFASI